MTDADTGFTALVYASTRIEELANTGWSRAQLEAFLTQQHNAQHHHYITHYPGLQRYAIVDASGDGGSGGGSGGAEDVGRLYLYPGRRDLRIVDIALLPGARGRGIGAALLADVKADAAARALRVSIHVERNNPARRLYERMGFTVVKAANDVYDLMAWHPPGVDAASFDDQ